MGKIKTIFNRIYADYLMPSRLKEYELIIVKSLEKGYEHITLKEYSERLKKGELNNKQRYFIHRHDIDSDIRTTKKMFAIERKHKIKTTYYFRLCTLDFNLMKEIEKFGSEASYHFEEIATYCKERKIKNKEEALNHLPALKQIFEDNFITIEKELGSKLKTVASHGDFVNRKLNLINNEITNDLALRDKLGIIAESYDEILLQSFDAYISDKPYPTYYSPQNIFEVIGKERVICMLTHPKQWETNFWENTKLNIERIYEGLMYS